MRRAPIDHGVCEPARTVVDVHDPLSNHFAIREGHESGIAVEPRVDHELLCETFVNVADIA